jgi:alpha-D-ribose 1-methylphosphonate 5-triphosphate synthase subunit PhnI
MGNFWSGSGSNHNRLVSTVEVVLSPVFNHAKLKIQKRVSATFCCVPGWGHKIARIFDANIIFLIFAPVRAQ